jgi:type II restriction/modification system DNA methylase subunit YeeA
MTPQEFVSKWKGVELSERSAAQQHFLDLCELFEHPKPAAVDKLGEEFTFERGLTKTGGGSGFADVWKKGFFAFEYKKQKRSLDAALEQLTRYASALENPPLHVACDTQRFKIVTAWTNLVPQTFELTLDDLLDPDKRRILWDVFHNPDALRPEKTRERLTRDAADKFTTIADRLNHRHPDREAVAHFINQLAFCFFAEDVNLLPVVNEREGYFTRLLKNALKNPANAKRMLDDLFEAMQHGGPHGIEEINHFNGGLFDDRRAFPLQADELRILADLGRLEWDQIDPTIFGTLFERFLDPDKRKQIGAHYTPPDKIMQIVEPVIARPLRAEWEAARSEIAGLLDGSIKPPMSQVRTGRMKPLDAAIGVREKFLERLRGVRILDPACGSGNFLYLALSTVKDIENRALLDCEALGLPPQPPTIDPEILLGIEINPLAAELARTTIWIGYIQWEIRNLVGVGQRPILKRLDNIECRDALVAPATPVSLAGEVGTPAPGEGAFPSPAGGRGWPGGPGEGVLPPSPLSGGIKGGGSATSVERAAQPLPPAGPSPQGGGKQAVSYVEAEWPDAEFIVGNPPFLGGKRLRRELGDDYVETLFKVFDGRVPREADLVTYWFEKARHQIAAGKAKRAGLVSTNSIRGGANRKLLERVVADAPIFEAWSDEPWVVEGAAVRVSLVCFGEREPTEALRLDGLPAPSIASDLAANASDLTKAKRLRDNAGVAFMGDTKGGAFDIPGELARHWLREPLNPNGRPNSDVIRPWVNGLDVTRRPRDMWIIDFGTTMSEAEAALYQEPFAHVVRDVKPSRTANNRATYAEHWWRHVEARPAMRSKLRGRSRYIATPRVARHRFFQFAPEEVLTDSRIYAFARGDDFFLGILEAKHHEAWSLRTASWHGVGNDPTYNVETCFETFPFPEGLTPNIPAADYADDPRAIRIAAAAKELDEKRRA